MVKFFIFFVIPLAAALWIFLFPRSLILMFRQLGRRAGDVGRAGRELLTGKEVKGSPLSRYETLAGIAVEEKILAAHREEDDREAQSFVASVGSRLLGSVLRREIQYRFRVIQGEEPIAYSLPGGAVLVSRGLLDLSGGDENQLAGILAHEVIHIDQRHAIRHLAKTAAARTGLRILSLGRNVLLQKAIGMVEELLTKGYGRDEELEADRFALQLSIRSGFDPRAYPYFLRSILDRRLENRGYFASHPTIPERLRALGI